MLPSQTSSKTPERAAPGSLSKRLTSAQVKIYRSWKEVLYWAPCSVVSLLVPPPSPTHALPSDSQINKILRKKNKNKNSSRG